MKAEMHLFLKTSLVDLTQRTQEDAVREFVQGKSVLDQHRWDHLVRDLGNVRYQPQPAEYVRTLLPFLSRSGYRHDYQQLVWVNPSLIVGFDSVRFHGVHNRDRERDPNGFCNRLDDQTRRHTTADAMGYYAPELGLHWLFEGLSRPALYVDANRHMPVWVNQEHVENGLERVVVAITGFLRPAYVICQESGWTALAMPQYSVPLLLASGFRYLEERWNLSSQIRVHRDSYRKLHGLYRARYYRGNG